MKRIIRNLFVPSLALALLAAPTIASAATSSAAVTTAAHAGYALMAPALLEGSVNINTASAKQLELLPGIGPATAEKIVAYRQKYPFKEALHLVRVKGVGRKTFAKIKPFLSVSGDSDLHLVKGAKR